MSTEREMRKYQEENFFENKMARLFLEKGKTAELKKFLNTSSKRLASGMTADEIDAVNKRAEEAFEDYDN